MSVAAGVGSVLQIRSKVGSGGIFTNNHTQNDAGGVVLVPSLYRFGRRTSRSYAVRRSEAKICESKFFGNRLRSERLNPLIREPKLRSVIRSALSQVPEQPLGLYDPKYDKDSCGVGFVAELSGESSRKTVRIFFDLILFNFGDLGLN